MQTSQAESRGPNKSAHVYFEGTLDNEKVVVEDRTDRFPLISIFAGELFVDAGTDFGSQSSVPGKPGQLLKKPGSGFSVGTGVIVTTPVGPLRLEVASQDFTGEWRFNLGVGWKF